MSPDLREEILIGWEDLISLESFPNVPQDHDVQENSAQIITTTASPGEDAKTQLMESFPEVIRDELQEEPIKGPPMKIRLREDIEVIPKAVHTA